MTKQDRIAKERLICHGWLLDLDDWGANEKIGHLIPDAWHWLEADLDCEEPKEKMTLYLDKSVARSFKAMGKGYQARITRLLRTWFALKAARMLNVTQGIYTQRSAMLDRRRAMVRDGNEIDLLLFPGELPLMQGPPEVEW